MFQFPGFASCTYVFSAGYPKKGGFPHSEIPGSKPVCRLTRAYRRLPRPSSPLIAKAFTMCAFVLDHITPKSLLSWSFCLIASFSLLHSIGHIHEYAPSFVHRGASLSNKNPALKLNPSFCLIASFSLSSLVRSHTNVCSLARSSGELTLKPETCLIQQDFLKLR